MKATSLITSIQRIAALNSMPSKMTSSPSMRAMLPRCRSPWHSRTKPCSRRRRKASRRAACSRSVQARSDSISSRSAAVVERAERSRRSSAARGAGFPRACRTRRPEGGDADRAVEVGDLRRERVDVGRAEQAALEQPARQRVLRKFAHLHRVFQRGSRAAEHGGVDAARDRHDVEVEVRGEPPVEPQLLVAEESPRRERGEIEEAEIDRLLDLVGEGAGQQHIRDVRLERPGGHACAAERRGTRRARRRACLQPAASTGMSCRAIRSCRAAA